MSNQPRWLDRKAAARARCDEDCAQITTGRDVGCVLLDRGRAHELSAYKGKILVLDFWATWCSPCLKAMPHIQKLHENFEKRGVGVLGLATQNDPQLAAAYMKQKGYTYPLLLNAESLKPYNPTRLPTLYIIGADGKIVSGETGNRADGDEKSAGILERQVKAMGK